MNRKRRFNRQRFFPAFLLALILCNCGATSAQENASNSAINHSESQTPPFDSSSLPLAQLSHEPEIEHSKTPPYRKWRGRIDTDFIWVDQSPANMATFGDLEDAVGLRRARIGSEGEIRDDLRYIAEIDLASGKVVIRDMFAEFGKITDRGEFRVGHFREPFSLEGNTSANYLEFMERSIINTLDPSRNWGLGHYRCSEAEDATFAIGVFHSGTDSNDFDGGDGADTSLTARYTMLPLQTEDRLIHLGIAASSRIPDHDIVLINQQPISPLLNFADSSTSPFAPVLSIPANFQQLINVQNAFQYRSLIIQSEWYGTWVDQIVGEPIFLHGCYTEASYFLTGEQREYHKQQGTFEGIKVQRPATRYFSSDHHSRSLGYGAWELKARFAYLDFMNDGLPTNPQNQPIGAELTQSTFGLNWYLADRLRIMFDYSYVVPLEPNDAGTANIFATRLGMFW